MKFYISSSWKNRGRVRNLASRIRDFNHEVYDFTDPKCRKSPEIPPEKFPEEYDPDKHNYEDTGLYPEDVKELTTALKEERLIKLPFSIGDTVYVVFKALAFRRVIEIIVDEYTYTESGLYVMGSHGVGEYEISTCYATREAAEAALKDGEQV